MKAASCALSSTRVSAGFRRESHAGSGATRATSRAARPRDLSSSVSIDSGTLIPRSMPPRCTCPPMLCLRRRFWLRLSCLRLVASGRSKSLNFLTHCLRMRMTEMSKASRSGAFVRVKVGLRKACKDFPLSIQAINSFARSVVPAAVWTSFALLEREQTSERKDTANSALPNVLIPVSCFSAGELCVHGPPGQVELEVAKGPVTFCARHHSHWSKPSRGRRVVLALFSLVGASNLARADVDSLERLNFPLPTKAALQGADIVEPGPIQIGPEAKRLLPRATAQPGPFACASPDLFLGFCCGFSGPCPPRVGSPKLVELCAGTAILSRTAYEQGWSVVPIDQSSCRFESGMLPLRRVS